VPARAARGFASACPLHPDRDQITDIAEESESGQLSHGLGEKTMRAERQRAPELFTRNAITKVKHRRIQVAGAVATRRAAGLQ
jgi:hypothetical protein